MTIADKQAYRKEVIDCLEHFASYKEQLDYKISVPIVDVPVWFFSWWDDLYTPGDDPSIYNPGVFEEGVREFDSCFSTEELEALKEFHKFFKSVEDSIPHNWRLEWLQNYRLWCELKIAAEKALKVFRTA